jgi:hypothetical protein
MRQARRVRLRRAGWMGLGIAVACASARVPALGKDPVPLDAARLNGISAYVESYFGRAQRLMVDETVSIQPLRADLMPEGLPRRLSYELRVEWDPSGDEPRASMVRQLMKVGSRVPKPGSEPECLDPKGVSPEPLAFLLPGKRGRFSFREAGVARIGGRTVTLVDYRPVREEPSSVSAKDGKKDCIEIDMPGRTVGRLWVDPQTSAILRIDEWLKGMTDVRMPRDLLSTGRWSPHLSVDRADSTIRYQPVTFTDPDETLLLPNAIETVTVIRMNGVQRLRITQTYRNYRRFVTGGRLVDNTEPLTSLIETAGPR